jgi:hypothetical protein
MNAIRSAIIDNALPFVLCLASAIVVIAISGLYRHLV